MFKKIACATALLVTVFGGNVHAGSRDLSLLTPTTKAQFFVALGFYKNSCSTLAPAAGEMFGQLEQLTGEMDQAELKKLETPLILLTKVANAEQKADVCNKIEPSIKDMTRYAEALPVKSDPDLASADDLEVEAPTTVKQTSTVPNYNDKAYTCDKDQIEKHLTALFNEHVGYYSARVLYVRDTVTETSRSKDELRCKVEVKTTRGNLKGVLKFFVEDQINQYFWQPGQTK